MMMIFLWSWNFIETVCRILKRVEWQRVIFAIDHFRARDVFLHHSNPWRAHGRDNGLRGYAFSWMRWLSASLYPLSPISSKGKRVFAPSGGAQWQRNFPYFNSHFLRRIFLRRIFCYLRRLVDIWTDFFSIDRPSQSSFLHGGKILFIRKNFHSIAHPVQYRNFEVFLQIGLMSNDGKCYSK